MPRAGCASAPPGWPAGCARRPTPASPRASSRRSPSIEHHGPLTLGALAEHERVAPPSITKVVAKLEADGLVARHADPDRPARRPGRRHRRRARPARRDRAAARRRGWRPASHELDADEHARLAAALDVLDDARPRGTGRDPPPRSPPRDTFRSLHVRNFRLFFGGQLISQIGNWLTLVAQTLLVLDADRQRRRRSACSPPPSSGRCCSSAPWPASSPTAPTSASCCSSCRPSPWSSRSCSRPSPSSDNPPVVGHLRRGPRRRRRHRLRQPGPPVVRRRDGARGRHQQRRQPQQRADDRRRGSSARPWPAC